MCVVSLGLVACDDDLPPFACTANEQCSRGSVPGLCVSPEGRCAHPSTTCPSGFVFDSTAGSLADLCVDPRDGGFDLDGFLPDDAGDVDMTPAPTCTDKLRNGEETDTDCGGSCVTKCENGLGCLSDTDCASAICNTMISTCVATKCEDGTQDGQETDVDCGGGGGCGKCAIGKTCGVPADCLSGSCVSNKCAAPASCSDMSKNGTETDVDCGGGACGGCAIGKTCTAKTDCADGQQCLAGQCNSVVKACAGARHTCALMANGDVRCWGWNLRGQVGDGMGGNVSEPHNRFAPVTVVTGASDLACSGPSESTCALIGGDMRCWGSNYYYQLGDGTNTSRVAPPASGVLQSVDNLGIGGEVSCATQGKALKCWGYNYYGSAGVGSTSQVTTPPGGTILSGVEQLATGGSHACAIDNWVANTGGTVKCWGDNAGGQLGAATPGNNKSTTPIAVNSAYNSFTSVGAGSGFSCATIMNGTTYCWGSDAFGQLGNTSFIGDGSTTPVTATYSSKSAACGDGHACAIMLDSVTAKSGVKCWGRNDSGQLGLGSKGSNVGTPPAGVILANVKSIAPGKYHTCAVLIDGNMKCWGSNAEGQLGTGNGSASESLSPTDVTW